MQSLFDPADVHVVCLVCPCMLAFQVDPSPKACGAVSEANYLLWIATCEEGPLEKRFFLFFNISSLVCAPVQLPLSANYLSVNHIAETLCN